MNQDTLFTVQVAAFVTIAIALVALVVLLALFGIALSEYIPEFLEAIESLERALREVSR